MRIYRQNRAPRGGVLAGCLIALALFVVLLVAGGVYAAMNWRSWVSAGLEQGMTAVIDEADLTQVDADAMKAEVAALMLDFENKQVSLEDLAKVVEEIAESPVLPAASIMVVDTQYIQSSELADEEKADGSTQLSRFMRGLFTGDISKTKIDDVTEPIHYTGGPGGNAFRINTNNLSIELKAPEDVTIEELQAFLANCKTTADDAGVPPERYDVDMAAEFAAAIDRALGRAPALPAPEGDAGETDDSDDDESTGEGTGEDTPEGEG
jgi:hypothetical protein